MFLWIPFLAAHLGIEVIIIIIIILPQVVDLGLTFRERCVSEEKVTELWSGRYEHRANYETSFNSVYYYFQPQFTTKVTFEHYTIKFMQPNSDYSLLIYSHFNSNIIQFSIY